MNYEKWSSSQVECSRTRCSLHLFFRRPRSLRHQGVHSTACVRNQLVFSPCVLQLFLFAMLGVASITGLSSFRSDNSRKFLNMYDCRYRDGSIWRTAYFNWAYSWIRQLQIKPYESWKHYSSRTARTTNYVKHLLPICNFCSKYRRRDTTHNCLHAFVLRS